MRKGANMIRQRLFLGAMAAIALAAGFSATASHISGIRITQTGNTGLMLNVDVTAFYTTGSTASEAYLGTYYNAVPAIDWGDGSTTPRYGYGPSTGIPLVATSTVVNGIPARAYRGSFSHTYGSGGSYTVSAQTRCCPLTTPTYTLVSGTIITTTVSTTGVFGPTTFTTSFVQNTLGVTAVPPAFSKVYAPDTVAVGVPSTLTFTIDNSGNTLDDNVLDFTDNLPAGVVVAPTPNVVNTCTGGTVTAVAGTATVSYSGGLVDAGATCTISVDTSADLPGVYVNTSGDLTSAFGNSGTSSDTLTVTATPPLFSKAFAPSGIAVGDTSTLTFTVDNAANAAAAPALDFTDNLPAGVTIATPSNSSTTCNGGTITAPDGGATISYSGGSAPAGGTCTVSVDVTATVMGMYMNTSGDLTSSFGNSGTASATLAVSSMVMAFSKQFAPTVVPAGNPSTLTFTLMNANAVDATAVEFTDTFPAGLVVAAVPNVSNTCTGGTVTGGTAGSGTFGYSAGTVPANSTCTISVDTEAASANTFNNLTGDLMSSFGNSGTAAATLTVELAPLFTAELSPTSVAIAIPATMTYTIDNSANGVPATGLAFTDDLPNGLQVSGSTSSSCGGTVTAAQGATQIVLTGGTVGANATCTVTVQVAAFTPGQYDNDLPTLTSSLGSTAASGIAPILTVLPATAVPLLSGLGLIIMSLLLIAVAWRRGSGL